jgi:hypothetical protein
MQHANTIDFSPYRFKEALDGYLNGSGPYKKSILEARWEHDGEPIEYLSQNYWNTIFSLECMTVKCRQCRDYYTEAHKLLLESDKPSSDVAVFQMEMPYIERHEFYWRTLTTMISLIMTYILSSLVMMLYFNFFTVCCVWAPNVIAMVWYICWRNDHMMHWHVPTLRYLSRGELMFYVKFYHERFHELADLTLAFRPDQ